jgi:hypothetical protein
MTTWSKDELRKIAEADDLHIERFAQMKAEAIAAGEWSSEGLALGSLRGSLPS